MKGEMEKESLIGVVYIHILTLYNFYSYSKNTVM